MAKRNSISIFDYHTDSDFLKATFESIKSERPNYSIRAWSKLMKAENPTSLARVLNGERRVPMAMIPRISTILELTSLEKAYLELISLGHGRFSDETYELLRQALARFQS
jgi:hypothetical protein